MRAAAFVVPPIRNPIWSGEGVMTSAPNGPFAANTTPQIRGQLVDPYGAGIPADDISALTLSLVDTLTGTVINSVSQVNILNTGRGTVDADGNLTITFETADMAVTETSALAVQRSAVIDWTYATSGSTATSGTFRAQVDFAVVTLAGP